jgi:hypothetical protein
MAIYRTALNETEQKAYDIIKPRLDGLGTILVLKEENGRIRLDVVSANPKRTKAELEDVCGEAAKATSCAFDVTVSESHVGLK